jgi:hypothetical protein
MGVFSFGGRGILSQLSSEGGTRLAGICSVLWSAIVSCSTQPCSPAPQRSRCCEIGVDAAVGAIQLVNGRKHHDALDRM